MSFIPPHPPRPDRLTPIALLRAARRDLLSIWNEDSFCTDFIAYQLMRRMTFVCNSPETVRQVFIDDAANVSRKSAQMVHALLPVVGTGLFISDGPTWEARRKVIAPVTHISRLAEFVPMMVAVTAERASRWQQLAGQEIDMLAEMAEMTAVVIARAVFGEQLPPGDAAKIVRSFTAYQQQVEQVDLVSLLGLPEFFPRFHRRAVRQSAARIREVVNEMLAGGQTEADGRVPSMARTLATALGDASGAALHDEATVLLMAGHETTANTLAWAWYCLSQDEESWQRLAEEVDSLGHPPTSLADVAQLPFTRAVIDETLRLFPPVPLLARRSREPREIAGHHVPAESLVMIVPWLLHRHRAHWEQPDTFDPTRFLPGGSGVPDRYAYVPFSIGPRICTGAAFALVESVIGLATLAQRFRGRLRPGHAVMPVCRLTLRPGATLPMLLEPRSRAA